MVQAILTGAVLGLALVFSMGPIVLKLMKMRINYGIVSAFCFAAGVWLSDFMWVVLANYFGTLLQELIHYKNIIGSIGGIILISIGIYYLFKKYKTKSELDAGVKVANSTYVRLFVTGFLINTFNPGMIALWLAAAAKTFDYTTEERISTFAIALGMSMTADFFKIELAGKIRANLTDRNLKLINKISGFLFILFGIAFIIGAFYK